jgi:hypothetical protein
VKPAGGKVKLKLKFVPDCRRAKHTPGLEFNSMIQ